MSLKLRSQNVILALKNKHKHFKTNDTRIYRQKHSYQQQWYWMSRINWSLFTTKSGFTYMYPSVEKRGLGRGRGRRRRRQRETGTERDRDRDRETERETDIETERDIERQRDRDIVTQAQTHGIDALFDFSSGVFSRQKYNNTIWDLQYNHMLLEGSHQESMFWSGLLITYPQRAISNCPSGSLGHYPI